MDTTFHDDVFLDGIQNATEAGCAGSVLGVGDKGQAPTELFLVSVVLEWRGVVCGSEEEKPQTSPLPAPNTTLPVLNKGK
eukprot:1157780-Pelagomonas_calceolata.AAC.12